MLSTFRGIDRQLFAYIQEKGTCSKKELRRKFSAQGEIVLRRSIASLIHKDLIEVEQDKVRLSK